MRSLRVLFIVGACGPLFSLQTHAQGHVGLPGDTEGLLTVCERVVALTQANLDRIRSATGTFQIEEELYFPHENQIQQLGWTTEFLADFRSERFHSKAALQSASAMEPGTKASPLDFRPEVDIGVITTEHFLRVSSTSEGPKPEFPPVDGLEYDVGGGGRIAYRETTGMSPVQSPYGRYLDARNLLQAEEVRIFRLYIEHLQALKDGKPDPRCTLSMKKLEKDGQNLIEIIQTNTDPAVAPELQTRIIYLVDDASSHVVRRESWGNGKVNKEQDWLFDTYETDILFPAVYSQVGYNPKHEIPTTKRMSTLQSVQFNQPIEDEKFGYSALELEYGNRLQDNIANKMLVMGENGLVPAEEFKFVRAEVIGDFNPEVGGSLNWLWWGLGIVVLVIGFTIIARRKRVAV